MRPTGRRVQTSRVASERHDEIGALRVRLKEAEAHGDWDQAVSICRDALTLVQASTGRTSFGFQLRLALNLGRRRGAHDVEDAIDLCQGLRRDTSAARDAFGWAQVHDTLGFLYNRRVCGDRAANQEEAIAHLTLASSHIGRDVRPVRWAVITWNLGAIYAERLGGSPLENVTIARDLLASGLEVLEGEACPEASLAKEDLARIESQLRALRARSL